MKERQGPLTDWELERFALGELPPDRHEQLRKRLEAEPGGAARLDALRRSDRAVLERWPAPALAREVRRRAAEARLEAGSGTQAGTGDDGPRRNTSMRAPGAGSDPWVHHTGSRVRWWSLAGPGLAAAMAALVVLRPGVGPIPADGTTTHPGTAATGPDSARAASSLSGVRAGAANVPWDDPEDTTRDKGLLPGLRVYRLRGTHVERLGDGSPARPHELLQLSYAAAGRHYGVVFSIDAAGTVTLHHPEQADDANRLDPSGEVHLPHAFELDETPGFERFFLVTSSRPFPTRQALEAAHALARRPRDARNGALPLPAELEQTTLLLEKVTP